MILVSIEFFNPYITAAKMIAKTFGRNCEVVVHDLTTPQNSVIFAVNNHVTGRKVGQSFDHLIREVLLSGQFNEDFVAGYETSDHNKESIKSSTSLIRDGSGKVKGALCINYRLNSLSHVREFVEDMMTFGEETKPTAEVQRDNVVEIADEIIDSIIKGYDVEHLKRKEKIQIVKFMDEKGIFLIKGAIDKVAEKLNTSRVTIYSYLDEIKKGE